MSFRYNTTQIYSGSREANPDTYYTSSNSASYVGGFIWITGSANIYTKMVKQLQQIHIKQVKNFIH